MSRWTIVGEPRMTRHGLVALARCVCGTEREVRVQKVESGRSRSCGCLASELRAARMGRHGLARTPVYRAWADMHQRCYNPKARNYPNYGGRGITVCARWSEFTAFYADMGPRPDGLTLDRIDVNGNYEPDNCRWATRSVQNANRRSKRQVEMDRRAYEQAAS